MRALRTELAADRIILRSCAGQMFGMARRMRPAHRFRHGAIARASDGRPRGGTSSLAGSMRPAENTPTIATP